MVFVKKECAITSKNNKVGGELKKIQPLILPDPESSVDSEDESIEDAVYDEDYRGDHNLTKNNIWSVVSTSWVAIEIFFLLFVSVIFFCYIEFFFKEERTKHEQKG